MKALKIVALVICALLAGCSKKSPHAPILETTNGVLKKNFSHSWALPNGDGSFPDEQGMRFEGDPNKPFQFMSEEDFNDMGQMGWARVGIHWEDVETTKGVYDFTVYDFIAQGGADNGFGIVWVLGLENPVHGVSMINPPTTQATRDAYVDFALATIEYMAANYGHVNMVFEIWNEPNIVNFWDAGCGSDVLCRADGYKLLAEDVGLAVRTHPDPAIRNTPLLLGSAAAGSNSTQRHLDFMDRVLAHQVSGSSVGALYNGWSFHPYRNNGEKPETMAGELNDIRQVLTNHGLGGSLALVTTEFGYQTKNSGTPNYASAENRRRFLVRYWLYGAYEGLAIAGESNWRGGIYEVDIQNGITDDVKALNTVLDQLAGFSFARRVTEDADGNPLASYEWVIDFTNGQETVTVGWTENASRKFDISAQNGKYTQTFILGSSNTITASGGRLTVTIGKNPRYWRAK